MGNQIAPSSPPKDPIIALVLSLLLLGGAGQLYLGQTTKGIVIMAVCFLTCGVAGIGIVVGCIDAYMIAKRLQEGHSVDEWEFFWTNSNKQLTS